MATILAGVGLLVVIGLGSVWVMRRKTEDHEMDPSQWIGSDFSDTHHHSHGGHASDGDSSGEEGGSGSDSGGSAGD
ncbi:MAG: hypothetical protein JNL10_19765 [Verrucomicrobiales bacterium]|nr:hypothetical protein [Verrucomicrobiales bacterium]